MPGKVAIAWLLVPSSITAPFASAADIDQLRELVEATLLELDAEVVAALAEASP